MKATPTPAERRFWLQIGEGIVMPYWRGPIKNKRWRLLMAYRALRGWELGGFR